MTEFLQRVEGEIQSRSLLARGRKLLVAVSGGADSMVLLHTLHSLALENRWQISVAHFNHRLRGRASEADEKLVRRTAVKLQLKNFSGGADVKSFAVKSKISVEMAARKLRHEFLAQVAREQKITTIALAHHADDQVELFFLRLLRGAGGEGLAGMKWRSPSPANRNITLIRPLLACTKLELLHFAQTDKVAFRDDATNFSTDFLRNRIRNELLPLLQKNYQPGLAKTVLRAMEIFGAEAEHVGEGARAWRAQPTTPFEKLSLATQRKVLQQQLAEAGVAADFELVERLRQASDTFVSVTPDFSVARAPAGEIILRERSDDSFNAVKLELKLQGRKGQTRFGDLELHWDLSGCNHRRPSARTEGFDADQVGKKILLRHWQPGDRFQPIGMKSAVKLQDLFVNAKIPAARRRELVLATASSGDIFWVEGLRIGENFKLTPATKRQLRWNWSKFAG